jgi:hypothetical protein
MSWADDLAALAGIRDHLARSNRLAPEEVAALASRAETLVRTARAALRRSEAAVAHLEDSLKPSLSADAGQDGDHATGPEA